jgi:hypothetical protein
MVSLPAFWTDQMTDQNDVAAATFHFSAADADLPTVWALGEWTTMRNFQADASKKPTGEKEAPFVAVWSFAPHDAGANARISP